MGSTKPVSTAEVKRQLVAQLDSARQSLALQSRQAQAQFSPVEVVKRSLAKHRIAWAVGGLVAGLVVVRLLLPAKFRSDKSGHSDKTRGISGLLRGAASSVVRRAAVNFATNHIKDRAQSYLQSLLNRPSEPERPPSHVASS